MSTDAPVENTLELKLMSSPDVPTVQSSTVPPSFWYQRAHVAVPSTPAVEPVMVAAVAVPFDAAPKAVALKVQVDRAV